MASSINSDNGVVSGSAGLKSTADASGVLALQSNGTTGLSLNTSLAIGVGSGGTSYGTSGQVLTSAGSSAAPTWSTLTVSGSGGTTASGNVTLTSASSGAQSVTTTTYGQFVKLPDATTMTKAACVFNVQNAGGYPLKVLNSAGTLLGFINPYQSSTIGLADSSTAAGSWVVSNAAVFAQTASAVFPTTIAGAEQVITIDADRYLYLTGTGATANVYAVVFNATTQTWGSLTLVASGGGFAVGTVVATNSVLVFTSTSTVLKAVVLSLSGTTITVNTPATSASASSASTGFGKAGNKNTAIVTCGSTYVCLCDFRLFAATVSGTTVTVGTALTLTGTSGPDNTCGIFPVNATTFLAFSTTSGTAIYWTPYSVSGTTMTKGTEATIATTGTTSNGIKVGTVSNGARWWVVYQPSSGALSLSAAIISVSGTTATASTVASVLTGLSASSVAYNFGNQYGDTLVTGSKIVVGIADSSTSTAPFYNIITDTAGTASVGTQINGTSNVTASSLTAINVTSTNAFYLAQNGSGTIQLTQTLDITGASPVLSTQQSSAFFNSVSIGPSTDCNSYRRGNQSWFKGSLNFMTQGTYTALWMVTNNGANINMPVSSPGYASIASSNNNDNWYQSITTNKLNIMRFESIA